MHLKDFHVHFVNQIHHMQCDGYLLDFIPVITSGHVVLDSLADVECKLTYMIKILMKLYSFHFYLMQIFLILLYPNVLSLSISLTFNCMPTTQSLKGTLQS